MNEFGKQSWVSELVVCKEEEGGREKKQAVIKRLVNECGVVAHTCDPESESGGRDKRTVRQASQSCIRYRVSRKK